MRFRQLPLVCTNCRGSTPAPVRQVGLTSRHQLVVHWRCAGCKREVFTVRTLASCWKSAPKGKASDAAGRADGDAANPDDSFLRSMGVRPPDEEETLDSTEE